MDPYLEDPAFWGGVHTRLINTISTALNRNLPEGYYAEIDEYIWLQTEEDDEREPLGKPDAFVTSKNGHSDGRETTTHALAGLTPAVAVLLPTAKKKKQRFVKIVGPDHLKVVTVIEVLSPSNKTKPADRKTYLAKRKEYLATGTSLVELDLLRGGQRMPLGDPVPDADYYFFVCRGGEYPRASVWPFTVREPIPSFPVPLKRPDPDVPLDLQRGMAELYDTNRYATRIDYTQPPSPAFRKPDAEWAAELLKKQSKKKKK